MKIFFIHSSKIDYNNEIYLPVLRSNYLSNHELIFLDSNENLNVYYKNLMDKCDLMVINLTYSDTGLSMMVKDAVLSKKPILAIAKRNVGYEAKYQSSFKTVVGYSNEEEFRHYVEVFVKSYEGKIIAGKLDPTIVLGTLNNVQN